MCGLIGGVLLLMVSIWITNNIVLNFFPSLSMCQIPFILVIWFVLLGMFGLGSSGISSSGGGGGGSTTRNDPPNPRYEPGGDIGNPYPDYTPDPGPSDDGGGDSGGGE